MRDLLHMEYRGRGALGRYLNLYSSYRMRMLLIIVMFVIKASPTWVVPVVTANIINLLTEPGKGFVSAVLWQFVVGAVFILQNVPTHVLYARLFSTVSRDVERNLRGALCQRLQQLSIPYHTSNKLGVLQTKVLRDVENIEMLSRMLVDSLPQVFITFAVAVGVTLVRAPEFLIFYFVTVPAAVLLYRLVRTRMSRYNREFRVSIEEMSGKVTEMLKLIPVTRAHNIEQDELERVGRKLEQVKNAGLKLDLLNGVFNSLNWVVVMFFNLLTLLAASLLSYYQLVPIKVGDVVLLTSYFNAISGAVMQLMNTLPNISKGMEAVKSVGEVLECPDIELNHDKRKLDSLDGGFVFEDMGYCYDGAETEALSGINLLVEPGETVAFVGPSGSGKSTLMQLVIGFIRPSRGRILIDGMNSDQLDLRTYRKFISVVSQETVLFDGSIRDNIVYGRNGVSDEVLNEVVASANLKEFVSSLPEGLETMVKENGARLSGGQKQRIAIARALIRDPRVLVLDEATSALDVEAEAQIQEALDRLIRGRTTFIVAHRLSTIRNAGRIVVLDGGRIVECGTYDELLCGGGVFARMNKRTSSSGL